MSIGEQIKKIRLLRQLTIRQLAAGTGLSPALISQIERDQANPSISSLKKIADKLEVPLTALFESTSENYSQVVRRNARKKLVPNNRITYELLSPNSSVAMELLYSIYEEGATSGEELYSHKGEEGGIVIQGTMEVTVGSEVHVLNEGDSIYFKADIPHRYRNVGKGKLIAIWAITPPSF